MFSEVLSKKEYWNWLLWLRLPELQANKRDTGTWSIFHSLLIKQMSSVKMSGESCSLRLFLLNLTTEMKTLWTSELLKAAPVKTEIRSSQFLFVSFRKAKLHQPVCVYSSLILSDHILLLLALWDHIQCFFQSLDYDQTGTVWHHRRFYFILGYMCVFLLQTKSWQIDDKFWMAFEVNFH